MQITETKIKVSELCQGYTDDGDGGIYGYRVILDFGLNLMTLIKYL